jgi:5S rRNA maturation endonuclease (ribonuclease M5)
MPKPATERLLGQLQRVKRSSGGWTASCPVTEAHKHGDRNPSLKIDEGRDGTVLIRCHAGCATEDVCAAVGIELADLFGEAPTDRGIPIETYDYTDADGRLIFQVVRYFPKSFGQRRPDGSGGWINDLRGIKSRPLFRLPRVVEGVRIGTPVVVVEGERDALTLEALGKVATTCPGGAGKWRQEHTETLAGAKVRIVTDADDPGRKHAEAVAAALRGVALEVTCWEPTKGKDIREHLRNGGAIEELAPMGSRTFLQVLEGGAGEDLADLVLGVRLGDSVIGEANVPDIGQITIEASSVRRDRYGVHAETRLSLGPAPLTHSMINLSKHEDRTKLANAAADRLGDKAHGKALRLRLDHFAMNVWEWWSQASGPQLVRGRGFKPPRFLLEPYVVEGGITMLYGPPKSGKSYVGMLIALTLTHGSNAWAGDENTFPVAFVNLERPPDTVGYRLQRLASAVGCPDALTIQHEKGRKFSDVAPSTIRWLEQNPGGVIVLDSLSRMGVGDLNSNEDTNRAMDLLHSLKASVVVLAHTPRSDASHVFGSVMHDAAADVLVRCEKSKGLDPSLMGVRVTVDDGNDVGWAPPRTWAFEFRKDEGLMGVRPARPEDFPDLADVRPIRERAKDYLKIVNDATTKEIAEELGISDVRSVRKALTREPETFLAASPTGKGRGHETWWTLNLRGTSENAQ